MKKKLTAFILLLLVMAFIPALIVSRDKNNFTEKTIPEPKDSADEIISLAASMCGEDFCGEAVKAMIILANTNYPAEKSENNNSDNEIYKLAKEYYNSNKEVYIQKNGEKLTIPYSEISNGATVGNDAYPYIYSTASAWDCLDSGFDKNAECAGVSLKGVDYLCRHGFSAEQALLHYLPGFEIKA